MSKNKYKRKREHAQQHAKQEAPETRLRESEVIHPHQEAASEATDSKGNNKQENSMSISERTKRYGITDWLLAIFTLALVVTSIYQMVILGTQLDIMRKDQRPWIKVSFTVGSIQALAPIGGTVHLVNNGKTPARGIVNGDFVVETVKNGEMPKLNYPLPHTRFTTGMITPNDPPADMEVVRLRSDAKNIPETDALMASEFEDFKQVKIFFVVYGTVHYSDFYNTDHWTKFCTVILPPTPPPNSTMSGQPCTNYADVDNN